MSTLTLRLLAVLLLGALAWAANPRSAALAAPAPTAAVPTGLLPEGVKPTAYRLELAVDPAKSRFSGHTEIDVELAHPAKSIFLHGNGLQVNRVLVVVGKASIVARYRQVEDSGVARLDFPRELPAGGFTLKFDYTADFRTGDEGLFHARVGQDWYAWTQLEPIDARRMASMDPVTKRAYLGDGCYGGRYRMPDDVTDALWAIGVEETREPLAWT